MSGQSIPPRTVFVLDVSGSMEGMKCETLQLSATRSIEEIPDGCYVAIVLFDCEVWIQHEVIQITDRPNRDGLIAKVPKMARGGTDIGSGLLKALDALIQRGISTENANIILMTDGKDTTGGNYVDRVLPTLLAAKVRISCIAIGNSADPNLERLSRETNSNIYIASDTNREMSARVIESAIQEVNTSTEMCEVMTISVCNDLISISHQSIAYEVVIDSDIGRNTVFTIGSEDVDKFSVIITSPNGHKYDSTSNVMNKDLTLKRYQLKPKTTESGVWTINVMKHSKQTLSASISVTSQPLNPNAIQMQVMLKDADSVEQMPPIIIAKLSKGRNAVIGAEVMATIDKPDGTQSHLKLINNSNDYMNYFTDYCGSGRYNVSVLAKSGSKSCQIKSISNNANNFSENVCIETNFQRQSIAGCFKVEALMPSKPSDSQTSQELNPINDALNTLSLISCSSDLPIEVSIPSNSRAIIKPVTVKKVTQKTDVMKNDLWVPYLVTKKLINSSKMEQNLKTSLENAIEEIFAFITSPKFATIEEIESKQQMLDQIKTKLKK